jgi:hypothetical protein
LRKLSRRQRPRLIAFLRVRAARLSR